MTNEEKWVTKFVLKWNSASLQLGTGEHLICAKTKALKSGFIKALCFVSETIKTPWHREESEFPVSRFCMYYVYLAQS